MNSIINFFITENEFIGNLLTFPLAIVELWITYIFITDRYNISINKKYKALFIIIGSILGCSFRLLLPPPFNTIAIPLLIILLSIFIIKLSLFKSIIVEALISLITILFEFVVTFFITKVLHLDSSGGMNIPFMRIICSLFIYLGLFLTSKVIKYFKVNLNVSDNMNKKHKKKTLLSILAILFVLCPNFIFLQSNNMNIPLYYVIYNFINALLFFLVGTYNTHEFNKLDLTTRELETAKLYNNTLSKLVDANRGFKHDMNNIVQAIGGYLELEDYDGLKKYYSTGLLPEIEKVNNLSAFNPQTINSAPVFGLVVGKYNYAETKNVKISYKSFFDYSTINMNIFDFVKIFGILLDNAIEAASLCKDEKLVDVYINIDFYNRKQVFTVKNTYTNKDVNISDIFQKNYSTKEKKSGFGLWEVKELMKKYQNTKLLTTKDDKFFCQKLEIYF